MSLRKFSIQTKLIMIYSFFETVLSASPCFAWVLPYFVWIVYDVKVRTEGIDTEAAHESQVIHLVFSRSPSSHSRLYYRNIDDDVTDDRLSLAFSACGNSAAARRAAQPCTDCHEIHRTSTENGSVTLCHSGWWGGRGLHTFP